MPDRNGKKFYTSIASLSHTSKAAEPESTGSAQTEGQAEEPAPTISGSNAAAATETDAPAESTTGSDEAGTVATEESAPEPKLDEPVEIPVDEIEASGGEGIIEQLEENARFQIYLVSAGSYDNAKESERDILVTDADGFAHSKDLPYGRYRVHQIEGMEGQAFIPDFTVFICEDGKTYSYILNNQTTSSFIRVEKRDAESKKLIPTANIGFQVRDLSTGEIISQTIYYPDPVTITTFYTTDESGVIFIENLRVQEYTVTELEDEFSSNYKRPDPVKVTLVTGETLTVNVHNQKVTVDVPKTGDESNMWLWIGLMGLGVMGIGAAIAVPQLKKKKTGKNAKLK